ncbi:phage integrase central domain-containing protein [Cryobacterium sinapicolor]
MPHRLKVARATETDVRRALEEQANLIRNGRAAQSLNAYSTIAEAAAVFLDDKRRSETVEVSTIETYEFSVNNVIIPECGNLLLTDLTVLRCNRILQHIRDTKSLSAARKARSMFSQICATGIEHGVLTFNPVRDARSLPLPPKKESALNAGQLETVRERMRSWRANGYQHGPRPNARLLENAMWIMVGTSARIGEVLALRRCDVDVTANPPTVLIAGTITQTCTEGLRRKPSAYGQETALDPCASSRYRLQRSAIMEAAGEHEPSPPCRGLGIKAVTRCSSMTRSRGWPRKHQRPPSPC